MLSLLVAAPGLDLDAREGLNMTPIILAAYWGVYEVIPPLVEAGADPDLQEAVGGAAAHWAAYYGYADTLQVNLKLYLEGSSSSLFRTVKYITSEKVDTDIGIHRKYNNKIILLYFCFLIFFFRRTIFEG